MIGRVLKRERVVDYDPFAIGCGGFLAPNKGDWACLENLALPVCHWLWRCPRGNGSDPWVGEARRRSPEKLPIYQNHLLSALEDILCHHGKTESKKSIIGRQKVKNWKTNLSLIVSFSSSSGREATCGGGVRLRLKIFPRLDLSF